MSQLLNDQNEFDHIVKDKHYRLTFLKYFEEGWRTMESGRLVESSVGTRLRNFSDLINQGIKEIEQNTTKMRDFGSFFGVLVGVFRFNNEQFSYIKLCSGQIVKVVSLLKKNPEYYPYFEALNKIINSWYEEKIESLRHADGELRQATAAIMRICD